PHDGAVGAGAWNAEARPPPGNRASMCAARSRAAWSLGCDSGGDDARAVGGGALDGSLGQDGLDHRLLGAAPALEPVGDAALVRAHAGDLAGEDEHPPVAGGAVVSKHGDLPGPVAVFADSSIIQDATNRGSRSFLELLKAFP